MTIIIIIITSLISIIAFSNRSLFSRLLFNAYRIYYKKEYFRLLTHGFLHANWLHLIINMLVLYSFGSGLENIFFDLQSGGIVKYPKLVYGIFYLSAIVVASVPSLKHRKDSLYNSVGASGAVSAIVFSHIFFAPWEKLYFYAVIPVPGIIFGVIYLIYSQYMSRKEQDNINHDAHFVGAIYGFIFPVIIDPKLFLYFTSQLFNFHF